MPKRQTGASVPSWLVLGAFWNPSKEQALTWPYLPEADLAPSPGEKAGGLRWREAPSPGGSVDLMALGLSPSQSCAAYAFTWVKAKSAGAATLHLGSDDGIAVWVNGSEVWRNDIQRGLEPGQDVVNVALEKGWNRLLLKVSQIVGNWGFTCSIAAKAPLGFSLKAPGARAAGRKAPPAGLAVAGARLHAEPGERTGTLAVALFNRGPRDAKGVRAAIVGAGGVDLACCEALCVSAFGFAEARLQVSLDDLSREYAAGAPAVEVRAGRKATALALPDEIAPRLLFLAPLAGGEAGEGVRDAARKGLLALEAYGPDTSVAAEAACEGLAALSAGDEGALELALGRVMEIMLGGVPDRRSDVGRIVGHAHIDMNWLWRYPETVKSCHDTFRQVIAFMDEYPDFTFLQSQPSTYRAVEAIDPPLFEKIRERVAEGRWEIAGGMVAEGDTNMSGGEALARSFLLGQRYFLDRFGKAACVGWLPDNFGHVSQLPQILKLAGCDFFYFHRCRPHLGTFWWEGTDGTRVLCYSNFTYNGRVDPGIRDSFDRIVPERRRLLEVCGVGDHGGGPTREDIESSHRLNDTPNFPTLEWSTAESFLRAELTEPDAHPVHTGEMQYTFEGCYTSIAKVKEGNRACENALYAAEILASLRRIGGDVYPAQAFRDAWDVVAFNEFHDILCGSAIHEANADAVADYRWSLSRAEAERDRALRRLADEVKTDSSLGQPIVVFNPQPRKRTALVEAEVFSHDAPATARLVGWGNFYGMSNVEPVDRGQGQVPSVLLRDSSGEPHAAQVVWGKEFPPGWRWRVRFIAEDLPAGGYATYYLDPSKPGEENEPVADSKAEKKGVFETDCFTVRVDMKTGEIAGLRDKRTGRELAPKKGGMGRLRVYHEKPHGMSAWTIGEISKEEDVKDVVSVRVTERGPVRACVEAVMKWGRSKFVRKMYLYRAYPRIDFELEAHWFEQGTPETDAPMLRAVFPVALKNARFDCHVPFDVVRRPATGREVPAQQWVDATDGDAGVALLNNSKYGHSYDAKSGELRLTLLRSSYDPDVYPDQGLHRIRYGLFPHAGDWKAGRVWAEGEDVNVPVLATEPPSRALGDAHATREGRGSLVELAPACVVMSVLKESEDASEIVARIAEVEGKETGASLTLAVDVKSARRLDIVERPLAGAAAPEVNGRTVRVRLRAHEIATVGVTV